MLPVPAPTQNANAVSGAIRVICFGRLSITFAATNTIQSMPPAACISAAVVTTARMIATAADGRCARSLTEHEHQDERAEAAPQADPHATRSGPHDDAPEHHQRLEHEADAHADSSVLVHGTRHGVGASAQHPTGRGGRSPSCAGW